MKLPSLDGLLKGPGVRGQRVFLRADLNVPMRGGKVADDTRIRACLSTLRRLLAEGARVIMASHLGRPKGEWVPELSLRPVANRLQELLGRPVRFCPEIVGPQAEAAVAELGDGEVLLLENLRFHPGETRNDPELARALAALADVYVDDAFGSAHRAHASTVGMVRHVARCAAGDLVRREIEHLQAVREPQRPLLCLLGGAKVSDKLAVLEALAPHADVLAVGGAMAYTFLRAQGVSTGSSRVEEERVGDATRVREAAERAGRRLLLPVDHVVVEELREDAPSRVVEEIPDGWLGVDVGPRTAELYAWEVARARTIFWNGPLGVFEMAPFAKGTETVARAIAEAEAFSVVGGGDSLAAVQRIGVAERIGHLSTGGGASLEFVQGLALPGLEALRQAEEES